MPRAVAVTWELVKSDLPNFEKKATLLAFDRVLGLNIEAWAPTAIEVPEAVLALAEQRQAARAAKDWGRADELRDEALAAGYVIKTRKMGLWSKRPDSGES